MRCWFWISILCLCCLSSRVIFSARATTLSLNFSSLCSWAKKKDCISSNSNISILHLIVVTNDLYSLGKPSRITSIYSWTKIVSPVTSNESIIVLILVRNSTMDRSPFPVFLSSMWRYLDFAFVLAWTWLYIFLQTCEWTQPTTFNIIASDKDDWSQTSSDWSWYSHVGYAGFSLSMSASSRVRYLWGIGGLTTNLWSWWTFRTSSIYCFQRKKLSSVSLVVIWYAKLLAALEEEFVEPLVTGTTLIGDNDSKHKLEN